MRRICILLVSLYSFGAVASTATGANAVPITRNFSLALQECERSLGSLNAAACPRVQQFRLQDMSPSSVNRFLRTQPFHFKLKLSNPQICISELSYSMGLHQQALMFAEQKRTGTVVAAYRYEKSIQQFEKILWSAAQQNVRFIFAPNAEWEPGLLSFAVILVDERRHLLTIIEHGDIDGDAD